MSKKAYNNIFRIFTIFTASLVLAFFVFSLSKFDFFKDFNNDAYAASDYYYVTELGGATGAGTELDPWSMSQFNDDDPLNSVWSDVNDPNKIDPGDTVYFSGDIITQIFPPEGVSGEDPETGGGYITLDGYKGVPGADKCNPVAATSTCATAAALDRQATGGNTGVNCCLRLTDNNWFIVQDFQMFNSACGIFARGNHVDGHGDSEHLVIRRNYVYNPKGTGIAIADYYQTNNNYNFVTIGGAKNDGNLVVHPASGLSWDDDEVGNELIEIVNGDDIIISYNEAYYINIPNYNSYQAIFRGHKNKRVLMEYNTFRSAPRWCVQLLSHGLEQAIIRFNKFSDCHSGIGMTAGYGITGNKDIYIYGNLFHDIYGGVFTYREYEDVHIWSNVFHNLRPRPDVGDLIQPVRITSEGGSSPGNVYIYNNTIASSTTEGIGIYPYSGQEIYVENNILYYNDSDNDDTQFIIYNSVGPKPERLASLEHNTYYSDESDGAVTFKYFSLHTLSDLAYMNTQGREDDGPTGTEGKEADPGFNSPDGSDGIAGTEDDNYTLIDNSTNINDGQNDFNRCFDVSIQDVNRHICYSDALSPATDWTQTPPAVSTMNQDYNGSGWERGAYVYSDSTAQNVNGFAWNGAETDSGIGWISFNSTDCDLNNDGNFGDVGAPAGCPAAGPTAFAYGVDFDPGTGNFSGYAWNNQVGWIYFGPDADLGAPYGMVQASDAPVTTNNTQNWANYGGASSLSGWAKILSMGDEGWISFRDDDAGASPEYGVAVDLATGDFNGWAWNGNDDGAGVGWISFNCENEGGCPNPYKVSLGLAGANNAPAVQNLATSTIEEFLCENYSPNFPPALYYKMTWVFDDVDSGDYQTKYDIQIKENTSFSDPPCAGCTVDYQGGVNEQFLFTELPPMSHSINFNEIYYWRVRVYDKYDEPSAWVEGPPISTPLHKYPVPRFYWSPNQINEGSPSKFIAREGIEDLSKYYDAFNFSHDCDLDPAPYNNCTYTWSVDDESVVSYDTGSDLASPFITFNEKSENFSVNLEVSDGLYSCSTSTDISTYLPLPVWIEN